MMQRTTLTAEAEDLDLFRREARRRGVSLNVVLNDIVHDAAESRRGERLKDEFAIYEGSGDVVEEILRDPDAPLREALERLDSLNKQ